MNTLRAPPTGTIPSEEPQIQHYLPFIALPFLIITSFTAPPFPGRGVIFASLIIIADYLSLTSPWPANEGPTRQSRYGIASSWLLVLPTLERLLLHVPERDFWRVGGNHDHEPEGEGHGHENENKRKSCPPSPPPPWTWRKIYWATALASTPRGVRWNFASRGVRDAYEAMARKKIGRLAFVRASLARATCAYLALDAVLVFGHDLPVPAGWLWNWNTIKDILVAELLMLVCAYASMTLQFETLAAVSVGLGFSKPEDWPPLFGSLADCYTVSNVWGKFWHTYIRLPVLGFGHLIVHCLHIPEGSTMAYLVILTVGFAISDFFHILSLAVIRDENISLQDLTITMSIFFMTQPLAAVAEALSIGFYLKFTSSTVPKATVNGCLESDKAQQLHTRGKAPTMQLIIGYFWVFCWFSITGWWFTKAYIAVGVRDWQIPLSFWQALMNERCQCIPSFLSHSAKGILTNGILP